MSILGVFLLITVAGAAGFAIGYFIRKQIAKTQANSIEAKAEKLLAETKTKQQQIILEAKEKGAKILDEAKVEEKQRREELKGMQQRIEKRESMFDQKIIEFQEKQEKLKDQIELVKAKAKEVETVHEEQMKKLEEIAGLTKEQALERLAEKVQVDMQEDLMSRIKKMERDADDAYAEKAQNLLGTVIERYASSVVCDNTITRVSLPNDEMKGRIIGKEGRNIKMIEQLTGCELIIDDTPEVITVSGFSPIRRQIARITLENLIKDGRIHPARIESFVEEAKKSLAIDIKKAGEDALYQLGLPATTFDPKLVSILGRLKYRTSFGQNNLLHSIEVANFSALLAEMLGVDVTLAKKAGLFHDIGKAVDHETQGGHPELGYQILKKFDIAEEIAYCCIAHHEDKPKTLLGSIAKTADALSASRPGARRDSYEQFIHRMQDLENAATTFTGVEKAYAIQAGREVRVFVRPVDLDDYATYTLAKNIAHKIESELGYPGEVKVVVIRETRVIEYAR